MNCQMCGGFYNPDNQSPVCPHLLSDPPLPRLGGPRLRPDIQREIDDAYALKDRYKLTAWLGSVNFAARYYAQDRINRLNEEEKQNEQPSLQELQEPPSNQS